MIARSFSVFNSFNFTRCATKVWSGSRKTVRYKAYISQTHIIYLSCLSLNGRHVSTSSKSSSGPSLIIQVLHNLTHKKLYREIIAVWSEIHTKHINTLCGLNVEMLHVKDGKQWTLKGHLNSFILPYRFAVYVTNNKVSSPASRTAVPYWAQILSAP